MKRIQKKLLQYFCKFALSQKFFQNAKKKKKSDTEKYGECISMCVLQTEMDTPIRIHRMVSEKYTSHMS